MDTALRLAPAAGAKGKVRLPGSKSISNRTLLLASVAQGRTVVRGVLDADDTRVMLDALRSLGVALEPSGDEIVIEGVGGAFPVKRAELALGNAGTAFRPLTALLTFCSGDYRLSGSARMHERPIGDLVDALNGAGASIDYLGRRGFPPLRIGPAAPGFERPWRIGGATSSQFLSALLMAPPVAGREAQIEVEGELISKPYVDMTLRMMERFGVRGVREGWRRFRVPAARYMSPGKVFVEGDASAASYFLAAAAIGTGPVRVEGVGLDSIQGDVRFTEVLERMGADVRLGEGWIEVEGARNGRPLRRFDLDLNHIPDAAMTAAVMALFADGPCTVRNVGSWRVKETDRLHAMAIELRKLGAQVDEGSDFLHIVPPGAGPTSGVAIDTYDDHRMAMCFSLVCLAGVSVVIQDPGCVGKTYPEFFADFRKLLVPAWPGP